MKKFYREWARKVNLRKGTMVTLDALQVLCKSYDPGYASVYMFEENAALEIKTSGASRGLDGYPVWSEHLVLDLDDGDLQLKRVEKVLQEKGFAYEVWSSGGKGYHIYIPHELIGSIDLPYSHLQVVKALGLGCDETLYQHGRIISLPGRVHPKTKRKKQLVKTIDGKKIDIPLTTKPTPQFNFEEFEGPDLLKTGLLNLANIAWQEPLPGNRHTALWQVAKDLIGAGLRQDIVTELLMEVNNTWRKPKPPEEVEAAVDGALRHLRA